MNAINVSIVGSEKDLLSVRPAFASNFSQSLNLPNLFAAGGVDRIEILVIGTDVNPPIRKECASVNWPARLQRPDCRTVVSPNRIDLCVFGTGIDHPVLAYYRSER